MPSSIENRPLTQHERPDISVIICTRNRAESLRITLEHLASSEREGIRAEVIVVDNAGEDNAEEVCISFAPRLPVRYCRELKIGKCHALNRALEEPRLGDIIAVLDDDMNPDPKWFKGVLSLCMRWPGKDLFTGRSHVLWPAGSRPAWSDAGGLRGWAFSVIDLGSEDNAMASGEWFSGNHFWFRSRCLAMGIKFEDLWLTEPKLMLDLVEMGCGAVSGPDAVVGHRIQQHLLTEEVIRARAANAGYSFAKVRLCPYRQSVQQAYRLHQHPLLGRLFCSARLLHWGLNWLQAKLFWSPDARFAGTVIALERFTYYLQLLRTASLMPEYSVFNRRYKEAAILNDVSTTNVSPSHRGIK